MRLYYAIRWYFLLHAEFHVHPEFRGSNFKWRQLFRMAWNRAKFDAPSWREYFGLK